MGLWGLAGALETLACTVVITRARKASGHDVLSLPAALSQEIQAEPTPSREASRKVLDGLGHKYMPGIPFPAQFISCAPEPGVAG